MPKKTKAIPDDRAEWTFGDALYWHFFIYGARSDGDPRAAAGRVWDPKIAAHTCDVTIRAFWNWIDDRHYPSNTEKIEEALFGQSKAFDGARIELRRLLHDGRQRRASPSKAAQAGKLPAVVQGQAVTVYTTPFEAEEVDGPLDEADLRALAPQSSENIGKTRWNLFRRAPARVVGSTEKRPRPSAARRAAWKGTIALIVLAFVVAAYGVKRIIEDFTKGSEVATTLPPNASPPKSETPAISPQARVEPVPTQRELPPQPAPPSPQAERAPAPVRESSPAPGAERPPTQSDPSLRQAPAPQASRPQLEEKPVGSPKGEAPPPRAEPAPPPQPAPEQRLPPNPVLPPAARETPRAPTAAENPATAAAELERAKKEAAARELNIKLKAMQKSEANDLCARKLEGLSVPGFILKCDTLIPFGRLLGAVPVSQTASSLGDCAARCERVPACVAFSFDAGAHQGAASCYLTGSIPGQNPATNWIAGIRE